MTHRSVWQRGARSRVLRATKRGASRAAVVVMLTSAAAGALVSAAQGASNRPPVSRESVTRGKTVYLQNCQDCHGEDGKAQGSAIAVAPDLTRPEFWKYGKTDAELFTNIRNGAGDNMPPFGPLGPGLTETQIWDLVNFIRSIGPQPK